jgi:hypothetical protein
VTARTRKSAARLEIAAGDDSNPPAVVNRLETPVEKLLLVDERGRSFVGKGGAGQTVKLEPAESQAAAYRQCILPLVVENAPRLPDYAGPISAFTSPAPTRGYPGGSSRIGRRPTPTYSVYAGAQPAYALPPTMSNSILERSIAWLADQMERNRLPPRSYVAIVERSPEVELGTDSVDELASFHILFGRW